MEYLITILGWSFLFLITTTTVIIVMDKLVSFFSKIIMSRKNKIQQHQTNEIIHRIRSASDWLGDSKRRPFQMVADQIARSLDNNGFVNSEELRIEVDRIIENEPLSDGYHTHEELYEFRKMYNAALFNEWAKQKQISLEWNESFGRKQEVETSKFEVHKSIRHHDGELCFGGGWFIVVAVLPTGQISNHYKMEDWDLFKIPETEKALYEFDGHTSEDVLERLKYICK